MTICTSVQGFVFVLDLLTTIVFRFCVKFASVEVPQNDVTLIYFLHPQRRLHLAYQNHGNEFQNLIARVTEMCPGLFISLVLSK